MSYLYGSVSGSAIRGWATAEPAGERDYNNRYGYITSYMSKWILLYDGHTQWKMFKCDAVPPGHSNMFLITCPPPLETSASPTSYLIIRVCWTRSHTTWSLGGETARALFAAHNSSDSLLSFGASTVYTCSMFSVLSKTMVFLSATVEQGDCGKPREM